jgi:hypothetical protein
MFCNWIIIQTWTCRQPILVTGNHIVGNHSLSIKWSICKWPSHLLLSRHLTSYFVETRRGWDSCFIALRSQFGFSTRRPPIWVHRTQNFLSAGSTEPKRTPCISDLVLWMMLDYNICLIWDEILMGRQTRMAKLVCTYIKVFVANSSKRVTFLGKYPNVSGLSGRNPHQ